MPIHHVVGTAGHVDHGKSSLVRALTGTDPDRLAEEKRRGMTIELGFAAWTLPGGERVGIVDVPGHRRFIRTMLAGAVGIDVVLLVVAADEGVMPQTREHLAICGLLGADRGIVALSKSDAVDADVLELARVEVEEAVAASPLRGAPVVACSAVTGEGLDELARGVARILASAPARVDRGRPRLFVDRSFALAGFGTVVTGTLDGGSLHSGEEVALVPGSLRARIRGLQHHGDDVDVARPGTRTAVNLAGIGHHDVGRGQAVITPGSFVTSARLDVQVRVIDGAPAPLRHRSGVVVYLGTAEMAADVWLLCGSELQPGQTGFARLTLASPVCVAPRDRFVLRRPSPASTLGGGTVLDVAPRRHRRRDAATAEALSRRLRPGVDTLVIEELRKLRLGSDLASLQRTCAAGRDEVVAALREQDGAVCRVGRRWLARERWDDLRTASTTLLATYHDAEPLRAGMPREEWRSRLRIPAALATEVVQALRSENAVVERGAEIAVPGRGGRVDEQTRQTGTAVVDLLVEAGLEPPAVGALRGAGLTPRLLRLLLDERCLVRLTEDIVVASSVFDAARERVTEFLAQHGASSVAEIRDHLGATRRVVVPLLERLDAARVTVRDGDRRRLRGDVAQPPPR